MVAFSADLDCLFTERPFLERFKAAYDAGFAAAEFTLDPKIPLGELGDACAYNGLKTAVLTMPAEQSELAFNPKTKKDFLAHFDRLLDVADFIECKKVYVKGMTLTEENFDTARDAFVSALHAAGAKAKAQKVQILIGFENATENEGFYPASTLEVLQILDELDDDKAFAYLYDVYHAQTTEGGISNTLESLMPLIGHIRVAGAPLHDEPDNGELNYDYLFSVIETHAYAGKIGCSYTPRLTTETGLKWMKKYV